MSSESQDNNSTTEQVAYDLEALAKSERIISISTSGIRKSLQGQDSFVRVATAMGSMFTALQKTNTIMASVQAATIATSNFMPKLQSIQPFAELVGNALQTQNGFAKHLLGALEAVRKISKQLQESMLPLKKLLSPIQTLQQSWFGNMAKNIGHGVSSVLSIAGNLSPPSFLSNIQQIIAPISKIGRTLLASFDFKGLFSRLLEWFRILRESGFVLVISASEGDQVSLELLGRVWWKIKSLYYRYCNEQGRRPTQEEFHLYLRARCQEFLMNNHDFYPATSLAKSMFWWIITKLAVDYAEVSRRTLPYNDNYVMIGGVKVSVYQDSVHGKALFTHTAAEEIGVTQQTLRNWSKEDLVETVSISYASRLKHFAFPALLIPYNPNVIGELQSIKRQKEKKMRHEIEGYFTITQVAKEWSLNRKTLERWDKNGLLVPNRINGSRYYTEEQKNLVPQIFANNKSPRYNKLMQMQTNTAM